MKQLRTELFRLSDGSQFEKLLKRLSTRFEVEESQSEVEPRTYYDTYDWRLHRHSLVFFNAGGNLCLQHFNGTDVAVETAGKRAKYFWWDLAPSELRNYLQGHIDMRALCPIIELSTAISRFRIMNSDRKTVGRLTLRRDQAAGSESNRDLPELVIIEEIRGYDSEYEAIAQNCSDLGFNRLRKNKVVHHLLKHSVRIPGDYGSKFNVKLRKTMSIGEAVAAICLRLLEDIDNNYAGVVSDIDSEFLHDFRIAIRRTRSLLSLLKKVLPEGTCTHFQREFRWLGSVTGPLRDIDVYLLEKEHYLNLLPKSLQGGMDSFFLQLQSRRSEALKKLQFNLNSERYDKLLDDWRRYLSDPSSDLFAGIRRKNCFAYAGEMIGTRFNAFIRAANRISAESAHEELHRLRIKGKKFRYLLEFFKSFYDGRQMDVFVKHMKKLQDNLGDFNDLSVQQRMLAVELDSLRAKNLQTIRFAAALGGLIAVLGDKHKVVRSEFEATYAEFARPEVKEILQSMIGG